MENQPPPLYQVAPIRCPDELRYALNSVASNFDKYAELEGSRITLKGLSPEQLVAHDLFLVLSEADDVIDNLNIALLDLERLQGDAKVFSDCDPFQRFTFLLRMFFYEFGRFEDAYGFFTHWQQRKGLISKEERKAARASFYATHKHAIKTRNVMMHEAVSWERHCSVEIALLKSLEGSGKQAVDAAGVALSWNAHIGPLCAKTLPLLYELAQQMRVYWNMEMAHVIMGLVQKGRMTKAAKPYEVPDPSFLKPGRPDR